MAKALSELQQDWFGLYVELFVMEQFYTVWYFGAIIFSRCLSYCAVVF